MMVDGLVRVSRAAAAKAHNMMVDGLVRVSRAAAPKARDMTARGKREARRPWIASKKGRRALKRAK